MLLTTNRVAREVFERETGWALRPEGACRGEICASLPDGAVTDAGVDVARVAEALGMPVARHSDDLAALGPATLGGKALATAVAPPLVLPDLDGDLFDLASLRGQKVVVVAWSPY
jgi:hypothetical protein